MERVASWPDEAQERLAEIAREMDTQLVGGYHAKSEELEALDEAERSGLASPSEIEAAFSAFRHV